MINNSNKNILLANNKIIKVKEISLKIIKLLLLMTKKNNKKNKKELLKIL